MSAPEKFPNLATGAVIQYSSERAVVFRTEVARFIDGTEQRFAQFAAPVVRWAVRLDLLTDAEVQTLLDFHATHRGRGIAFSFTDPWTGIEYPSCSFESDQLEIETASESQSKTQFILRSNRE
jgi:Conserved hypothetical protein 2217 (DUF2460)